MLRYVPKNQTDKLLDRPALLAKALRINALYMVERAGKGHLGTSLSSMEAIVAVRHLMEGKDMFVSSKGHDAVAQYATLIAYGLLEEDKIHDFRREGGLPGHPTIRQAGIRANTGSLGMGLSKALGFAIGRRGIVHVLLGDGEMMEGQNYEAMLAIKKAKVKNIIALVDYNAFSQDGHSKLSYKDIRTMFRAAGWSAHDVHNGNDYQEVESALKIAKARPDFGPWLIMLRTTKGSGIEEIEGRVVSHFGPPRNYEAAYKSLKDQLPPEVGVVMTEYSATLPDYWSHPLYEAFGAAMDLELQIHTDLVFVGADTLRDLHCYKLINRFPGQVFDFGIAEQNAVSFASAQALLGKKVVVATYAAFLRRAFEQIYNQVTEGTNVTYVGSLAGPLDTSGPGVSHESLDDLKYMGNLMQTRNVPTIGPELVQKYLIDGIKSDGPSYIRLCQ